MVSAGLAALGRKNAGVFVRLKASARNCRFNRSRNAKLRNTEKSRFLVLGPRPARRDRVPNFVNGVPLALSTCPGWLNAAGLNHPSGPPFGKYIETPGTASATLKVANNWFVAATRPLRISVGYPLCLVKMPFSCQPPNTARPSGLVAAN